MDEEGLLQAAQELVRVLRHRAAATTEARDVLPETIADYHRTGILRIIQPRRFGGLQLRFSLFSRIVEMLTEGCPSSAWVYAVLGEHQFGNGGIVLTLQAVLDELRCLRGFQLLKDVSKFGMVAFASGVGPIVKGLARYL